MSRSGMHAGDTHESWLEAAPGSSEVVNRTHRVVRERALRMQAERSRTRSLYLPLAVSAVLIVAVVFAVWTALDQYDLNPEGVGDFSPQFAALALWCLPATMIVLGVVWLRRGAQDRPGQRGGMQ